MEILKSHTLTSEGNRFKFLRFSERIAAVDIDVHHHRRHLDTEPDVGTDSYTLTTLRQYRDLNLTADYTQLSTTLYPLVESLPLLLHNQAKVVDILLDSIRNPHSLALRDTLVLIASLARDLRGDFYAYFPSVFANLVNLVQHRDPQLLESVFQSLAFLIKYLLPQILDNLKEFLQSALPLLQHTQSYIRRFAAESLSYLLRKCKTIDEMAVYIMDIAINKDANLQDGAALLLCETVLGMKGVFHSKMPMWFNAVIGGLAMNDGYLPIAARMVHLMAEHVRHSGSFDSVWDILLTHQCPAVNTIIRACTMYRHGLFVSDGMISKLIEVDLHVAAELLLPFPSNEAVLHVVMSGIRVVDDDVAVSIVRHVGQPLAAYGVELCVKLLRYSSAGLVLLWELLNRIAIDNDDIVASLITMSTPSCPHKKRRGSTKVTDEMTWMSMKCLERMGGDLPFDVFNAALHAGNHHVEATAALAVLRCCSESLSSLMDEWLADAQRHNAVCLHAIYAVFAKEQHQVTQNIDHLLASYDPTVRMLALRIMLIGNDDVTLQTLLEFELEPLDTVNGRERITKLQTLSSSVRLSSVQSRDRIRIIYSMIGAMRTPYSAQWSACQDVLCDCAKADIAAFWRTYWPLAIEVLHEASPVIHGIHVMENDDSNEGKSKDRVGFLGPDAVQSLEVLGDELMAMWQSETANTSRRTDAMTLSTTMLNVLVPIATVIESRTKILTEFLAYVATDLLTVERSLIFSDGLEEEDEEGQHDARRASLLKLSAVFSVISSFKRPSSLPHQYADVIHSALPDCLIIPINTVRISALQCLIKWRGDALSLYETSLKRLASDDRDEFKQELTAFALADDTVLHQQHRSDVIPVVIRLLWAQLLTRKGKTGGGRLAARRAAILSHVAMLPKHEMALFMDLLIGPFRDSKDHRTAKKVGFLLVCRDVIAQMGRSLTDHLSDILSILLSMINDQRRIVKLCYLRLSELFAILSDPIEHMHVFWQEFMPIAMAASHLFAAEQTQGVSAQLRCFVAMSKTALAYRLIEGDPCIAVDIVACLGSTSVSDDVIDAALTVVEHLCDANLLESIIPQLLDGLSSLVLGGSVITRVQALLARVAPMVSDPVRASKIVHLLMPFIGQKNLAERSLIDMLDVVTELSSLLSSEEAQPLVDGIAKLLSTCNTRRSRECVCRALAAMTARVPELECIASIVMDLNAYAVDTLDDEPDWERRSKAFTMLETVTFTPIQYRPILYSHTHAMNSDDLAARLQAVHGVAAILNKIDDDDILNQIVMPSIRHGVKRRDAGVRSVYINLLGDLGIIFPARYPDLARLHTDDVETDTFANLVHIQVHRRIRAVKRLEESAGVLSPQLIIRVWIPLLLHAFTDAPNTNRKQISMMQAAQAGTRHANLVVAHGDAIAAMTQRLAWTPFHRILNLFITLISAATDEDAETQQRQRALVKLFVSVVDKYDFDMSGDNAAKITHALVDSVLPSLMTLLTGGKAVTVARVSVSLAIARILKLLPQTAMETHFPPLLTKLCRALASRDQGTRDAARTTLSSVTSVLGTTTLATVLEEMRATLKRGYQLHVLTFTAHSIAAAVLSDNSDEVHSAADDCVNTMMDIVIDDVFGDTHSHEATAAKATKEASVQSAHDLIELVASKVTFNPNIAHVIAPLHTLATERKHHDTKSATQIEGLLRRVVVGIQHNDTVVDTDLLKFVHQVVTQKPTTDDTPIAMLPESREQQHLYQRVQHVKHSRSTNDVTIMHTHLFNEMALLLLYNWLRAAKVTVNEFIPMLLECVQSKHTNTVVLALKCLNLINTPVDTLADIVLQLLANATDLTDEIPQLCIKSLIVLLKHEQSPVSETQLRVILKLIQQEIEEKGASPRLSTALSLLRAALHRGMAIKEIYDVMETVMELSVQSPHTPVRHVANQTLAYFLASFPIGKRPQERHLNKAIANLDYAYPDGRESALELANSLIVRFPAEFVEFFYLPLVTRLVNENDTHVHGVVVSTLKRLLSRMEHSRTVSCLKMAVSWLDDDQADTDLRDAAVQAIGVIIDACGATIGRDVDSIAIPALNKCLMKEESVIIHRALQAIAHIPMSDSLDWLLVAKLMVHTHAQIRIAATHAIGVALDSISSVDTVTTDGDDWPDVDTLQPPFLARQGTVLAIGRACVDQLCAATPSHQVVFDTFIKACKMMDMSPLYSVSGKYAAKVKDKDEMISSIQSLYARLCRVARRDDDKRDDIVQFSVMLSTTLSPETVLSLLDDTTMMLNDDDEAAIEQWRDAVGTAAFYEAWRRSQSAKKAKRDERKRKLVLADPAAKAKRKMSRNMAKRRQKKAKIKRIRGEAPM